MEALTVDDSVRLSCLLGETNRNILSLGIENFVLPVSLPNSSFIISFNGRILCGLNTLSNFPFQVSVAFRGRSFFHWLLWSLIKLTYAGCASHTANFGFFEIPTYRITSTRPFQYTAYNVYRSGRSD